MYIILTLQQGRLLNGHYSDQVKDGQIADMRFCCIKKDFCTRVL